MTPSSQFLHYTKLLFLSPLESIHLMKELMRACTPQLVLDILIPELEQKNAKVRDM